MHPDADELTLLALGQTPADPEVTAHLAGCADCQHTVAALADTVALARAGGADRAPAPPPTVWAGIAAELGLSDDLGPGGDHSSGGDLGSGGDPEPAEPPAEEPLVRIAPVAPGSAPGRPWWRGVPALAAAAVVALVVALGAGWLLGRAGSPAGPRVVSTASLAPLADSPEQAATGTAHVQATGDQRLLSVDASGLPAPDGYYEVWLFDPKSGRMVAMGTLDSAQHGTFPMPPNLDPARYPVVDISAQQYNGDNTHSDVSVLRGQLGG